MKNFRLVTGTLALVCSASICAADDNCADPATAKSVVANLNVDITTIQENRKAHEKKLQDEVEAAADKQVSSGQWSKQKRSDFFLAQLKDAEYMKLEEQKQAHLKQFMKALEGIFTNQTDDTKACLSAVQAKSRIEQIGALNDQQYAVMLKNTQKKQ